MLSVSQLLGVCCLALSLQSGHGDVVSLHDTIPDPTITDPEMAEEEVGDEVAGLSGPPPQVMLGTSGTFKLASQDSVPKLDELGEGRHRDKTGEKITLGEAAKILSVVGAAADPHATLPRGALDALIQKATKQRILGGEAHVVVVRNGHQRTTNLGEALGTGVTVGASFRYTNGIYGGNGGKKKWLKCESECKGSAYGGYGYCMTNGEGSPWGGCMAPGSDPAVERPPRLYAKNRITTADQPRSHMFCDIDEGGDVWIKEKGQLVAGCTNCVNEDYFLVPNHHVQNMMVGTCFKIDQFEGWVNAATKALEGGTAPLECSVFTNDKGMRSQYFGGRITDQWDSSPKGSAFNPRAFLCTTAGNVHDHTVMGLLSKGYREMRVFSTTVARFVMCHTDSVDGTDMKCVKKTRIGKCRAFYVRNAAFDQGAFHVVSPAVNQTGVDWEAETTTWDAKALKLATKKLLETDELSEAIGFHACDESWNERILAVHQ